MATLYSGAQVELISGFSGPMNGTGDPRGTQFLTDVVLRFFAGWGTTSDVSGGTNDGAWSFTVQLQDSPDQTTWTTRDSFTFTALTAATMSLNNSSPDKYCRVWVVDNNTSSNADIPLIGQWEFTF